MIDLKGGQAVHAVAGDRAHYQPVRSRLHPSADPLGLARVFVERLGLRSLYLADLDAIAGRRPAVELYAALQGLGVDLWVDAGVRHARDCTTLLDAGVSTVVVGSETVANLASLPEILAHGGPDRLVFSLDLKAGRPLWAEDAGDVTDPLSACRRVLDYGVRRLLLLDLARVGTGTGLSTLPIVRELVAGRAAEIAVGGGIAGVGDIDAAGRAGVGAVLIGTSLHNGAVRIERGQVVGPRPMGGP